jgi:hypothetical protein
MACQKKVWDQTQKVNYQGALDPNQGGRARADFSLAWLEAA